MAKDKRKAALDTCALSFYQQGRIPGATEDDIRRADRIEHFMKTVYDDDGEVFLPAICLGEYLSQFDDAKREQVREGIEENFLIIEYGVEAALKFAKMRRDKDAFLAAKDRTKKTAQAVKVDCLITATVQGYGSNEILTDNSRDFAGLSGNQLCVVLVNNLPDPPPSPQTPPVQRTFFDDYSGDKPATQS